MLGSGPWAPQIKVVLRLNMSETEREREREPQRNEERGKVCVCVCLWLSMRCSGSKTFLLVFLLRHFRPWNVNVAWVFLLFFPLQMKMSNGRRASVSKRMAKCAANWTTHVAGWLRRSSYPGGTPVPAINHEKREGLEVKVQLRNMPYNLFVIKCVVNCCAKHLNLARHLPGQWRRAEGVATGELECYLSCIQLQFRFSCCLQTFRCQQLPI